jgi:transposase InsO family protein
VQLERDGVEVVLGAAGTLQSANLNDVLELHNHHHPHSSLVYLAPAEFARRWRTITISEPS